MMNLKEDKEQVPYPPKALNEGDDGYRWTQYNEMDQQKIHLWISDPPTIKEIYQNESEKLQIDYKMALPYYVYEFDGGKQKREKISVNSKKESLDMFLKVFEVKKEDEEKPENINHDQSNLI